MNYSKYPFGEGKSLPHQKKKNGGKKRTVTEGQSLSGTYPYSHLSKIKTITKRDKKGDIKKQIEKRTGGDVDPQYQDVTPTKTRFKDVTYKSKTVTHAPKGKKSLVASDAAGSVGKTKSKSDEFGKEKRYFEVKGHGGSGYRSKITKKEYKQRKRKL